MNNEANYHSSDWIQKKVDDIVDVIRGTSWKHGEISKDGVAVLTIPNIQDGRINYSTDVHLKKHISSDKRLKKGDTVAVASSGSIKNIGRSALVDKDLNAEYTVASFLLIMRSRGEINSSYLYYLSKSDSLKLSNYGRRAADGKFNFQVNEFRNAVLALPSKLEQEKIAFILTKLQQAIEQQEKIITKTKELKRSLMQRLFTYGLRGEELKETEIGLMPESWEVRKLGDIATLKRGYDLSRDKFEKGKIPVMGSNGCIGYHNKPMMKGPGVITGRSGSIGKMTYIEDDYWPHNTALYVKDFHGNDPLFIYYLLHKLNFNIYKTGVSVPTLNRNFIHMALLPKPSIEEQKEITNILSNFDKRIQQSEARKQTLQALFKSMLQLLMTGQVRVKDIDFGEGRE